MSEHYTFTSESVTEGHPDKMCDQISDAVLDALFDEDPQSRVACESMATTGVVFVAGEISTTAHIDIQRVVRDNFGRFRGCYEAGLRDNPALEGRVITRFAIDRQGVVTMVQDGGSTLPNPGVVACVLRSFYSLSFPEHQGGIVTVVYPLALRPD